ncbi:ATP-grasp domain protein [Desulfarculus baarsii DSM 2075]|uniref:ATP-grasp domain protein n=1 Tax=Desulfarculus baarsii (strain ATCC 33931 / DSM 2075 / LMG 7858 / VKM B-1802 / 2st14) TaxID=644282 RepID=E1QIQ7_DESB2|nr:acetate--CoA ligase family protein [Desulfarculus baarsii]ADK84480.1 ATP-grasp domain protein [Desulfarculus baarsii DSM 2075]
MKEVELLIKSASDSGQAALSEYDSKKVLAAYGVPVTREILAGSADEAIAAAQVLGGPVALKACSAKLLHKTERGAVRLGLRQPADIARAFAELMALEPDLDGVLVQEMVSGARELVMGLKRDAQFGPCVMLGLGGVLTEILADTAFRAAPIDAIEARDMCDQLRGKAMLGAFRGQAPADMDALCAALVGLGRIGLDLPAVSEIDVNPLIIDANGRLAAVDALVVLGRA